MRFKITPFLVLSLLLFGLGMPRGLAQFTTTTQIGGGALGSIATNAAPGSYTVVGGGNDIWDASDEFTFHHAEVVGDFDVRVRVDSLEPAARWSKAGIMVRESVDGDSRMAFAKVSPSGATLNGNTGAADASLMYRTWMTSPGSNGGQHEDRLAPDPGYPSHKWLRLERAGTIIRGYASTDGLNWNAPVEQDTFHWLWPVGGTPTTFNGTALLGLAVSRHASATQPTATAEFSAYANVLTDPAAIAEEPQDTLAFVGTSATFNVLPVGGLDVYSFQWRRDGAAIPGATASSYTTPILTLGDDAAYDVVITNTINATTATSATAQLTVSGAPTLQAASNRNNPVAIYLDFSEPMDSVTALDENNYSLNPAITLAGPLAFFEGDESVVVIPTQPLLPGTTYSVMVSNVFDQEATEILPNPSSASFQTMANGFFADFDTGLPEGAHVYGSATVDAGVLKLTPNANDQAGSIVLDEIMPGTPVHQFNASFKMRLADGSGNPADGFSFNFANDLPDDVAVPAEGGVGSGLSVGFHFYNDDFIEVKMGGVQLTSVVTQVYGLPDYVECLIQLNPDGTLDLTWNGEQIVSNLPTGYTPMAGRFGIYARTGGENASQWMDDLSITNLSSFQPGPAFLTLEPSSQTVDELETITLQTEADGSPPLTTQWYRNGTPITDATNLSYTFQPALADDQAAYHVEVSNLFSQAASSNAVLTVLADTNPPTLVSVVGDGSLAQATLRYSEPVNAVDATDTFNYQADNNLSVLQAVLLDDQTVLLTTSAQTEGTVYTLSVNGIRDLSSAENVIAPDTFASFTAWVFSCGFVQQDLYMGIGGGLVSDLTNNPVFPDSPSQTTLIGAIEGPLDFADSYGQRLSGHLTPNVSGNYNFWISSDDESQFYLSTDANPANLQLICFEPTWNGYRNFKVADRRGSPPENASTTLFETGVPLVAGEKYAFLLLHKEGGGGDNVSVTWQVPGEPEPDNGAVPIQGNNVCISANPDLAANVTILEEPQSQGIVLNQLVKLNIDATNDQGAPQSYQWRTNGVLVRGETASTFEFRITDPATVGTDLIVEATVTVPGRSVASNPATLSIDQDTAPPELVATAAAKATQVGIAFNEVVDETSATDMFNYVVQDSCGEKIISDMYLRPNGSEVVIYLNLETPVSGTFTVEVSGVEDLAGNAILPGSTLDGPVWAEHAEVGGPLPEGTHFTTEEGILQVTAGGADIWGQSDQFGYVYNLRTADFDVTAKITRLDAVQSWAKAGIMVRPDLDPAAPNLMALTTSPQGQNVMHWQQRPTRGADSTSLDGSERPPANEFPIWVRIKRTGTIYEFLFSRDGTTWNTMGNTPTHDLPSFAGPMLVGPATTSHLDGTATTAEYVYGDTFTYPDAVVSCTGLNDVSIEENRGVTLAVDASVTDAPAGLLELRWYIESPVGSGCFVPIEGAYGTTITTPNLTLADDQTKVKVVASVPGASTECMATVTVTEDTTPPVVLSATGSATLDEVTVVYDERMDVVTASERLNYVISDGAGFVTIQSATLSADETTVTIALDPSTPLQENTEYTVSVFFVRDLAGNSIVNPSQVSFRSFVVGCGGLVFERYDGINGTAVADLTNNAKFPDNPDSVTYLTAFNSGENLGDNFGGRIRGFFIPPESGNWIFYMRSDDASQLFLNPAGPDPAGRQLIANEPGCCGNFAKIQSTPIALIANQAYYLEGLYKEGGGGDRLLVAAKLETDPRDPDVDDLVIKGSMIGDPSAPPGLLGEVTITTQPQNLTVEENHSACFTVEATNPVGLPQCYQWYKNGVAIEGATESTYCAVVTPADNGASFSVVVGIMGFKASSQNAILTVIEDNTLPTVISALPTRQLNQIHLQFSERMDAGTATDIFNYFMLPPLTITLLELSADETSVTVTLDQSLPPEATTCVTISGVTDIARNPLIETNVCVDVNFLAGYVQQEIWLNLAGSAISDLTNHAAYPDSPDIVRFRTLLEANSADEGDNYGTRMSGWLKPPVTGTYHFAISSDDSSQLYLSTDASPGNVQLICYEPTWNGRRDWLGTDRRNAEAPENRSTTLFPDGIELTADELYYFEALLKEGGGGDNMAVTWSVPPQPGVYAEARGQLPISGNDIVQLQMPIGSSLNFTEQPSNTVYVLTPESAESVTFNVAAEASLPDYPTPELLYQWQWSDGEAWWDIPFATGSSFTLDPFLQDDGAQFRVRLRYPGIETNSEAATLNVIQPNSPPVFQVGSNHLVLQDSGPAVVTNWSTQIAAHSFDIPPAPVIYETDFSEAPMDAEVLGNAIVEDGVCKLTINANSQLGAFYGPSLDVSVASVDVAVRVLMGDGTESPADGMSINIANDLPPDGSGDSEEGLGSGLSLCFDSWDNGGFPVGEGPAIDLKYAGQTLESIHVQPSQGSNAAFIDVTLSVTEEGLATVTIDGTNLFTDVTLPAYRWESGLQVGLAARTGGANDNHWIDDLLISAVPVDMAAPEQSQIVSFVVSNDNPSLFAVAPAISSDGTLSFTPALGMFGMATNTVYAMDDGGTNNGGINVSATEEFVITVNAAPVVSFITPTAVAEYVVPQNIIIQVDASDPDGAVTQVEIFVGTNLLTTLTNTDLYVWSGVPPGNYQLQAVATDNLGQTGISAISDVTVYAGPSIPPEGISVVDINSPRVRQSGLFYQTIQIENTTSIEYDAVLLTISNLPPVVQVWNATGMTNGLPYILFNHPIATNSSVTFEVEFFVTDRRTIPNPTYNAVLVPPQTSEDPEGTPLEIVRVEMLADSSFLLEFSTVSNSTYYVQYRTDVGASWKTAQPAITGTGTRIQWIDSGPPKTDSPPADAPQRLYQVIQVP